MVSIGEPRSYGTKDVSALFEHELVKTSHKRKNSYPTPLGIAKPQKTAPRASQTLPAPEKQEEAQIPSSFTQKPRGLPSLASSKPKEGFDGRSPCSAKRVTNQPKVTYAER